MIITLVFVHSPLLGPTTWQLVAEILQSQGFRTIVPSLRGVLETGPPYYEKLAATVACALNESELVGPVIIVAHSGAGSILPAITAAVTVPVSAALFVDAVLPHPGTSEMATLPRQMRKKIEKSASSGWLPPWNDWFPREILVSLIPSHDLRDRFIREISKVPLAFFEERAPIVDSWTSVHCAYLQLSTRYERDADEARNLGWVVHRLRSNHLAMITQPLEVAEAINLLTRQRIAAMPE